MATKTNLTNAKVNLSKLITMAMEGEEVIISGEGKSVVKLVPVREKKKRKAGVFKNEIELSNDIDKPLPAKVTKEFYK